LDPLELEDVAVLERPVDPSELEVHEELDQVPERVPPLELLVVLDGLGV